MRRHISAGTILVIAAAVVLPPAASAAVSSAPPTRTFASQQVGTTSATQPVTITVTCELVVVGCAVPGTFTTGPVFSGANPGDFTQTNNCGVGVSHNSDTGQSTCQFQIAFKPTAAGSRAATLTMGSGGFPVPTPKTVGLTGTAVAAPVATPTTPITPTTPTTPGKKKGCKKGKGKKKGCKKKKK